MQPNPWDDGYPSSPPNGQQSGLQSNGMDSFPSNDQSYIAGTPQAPFQPILIQQPSATPKVIGVLFILYGLLSSLGVLAPFLEVGGTESESRLLVNAIVVLSSIISAVTAMVGGYWLMNYQRRGVHLIFLGILVSSALAMGNIFLGEVGEIDVTFGISTFAAQQLAATFQTISTVICGLIAVLPVLTSSVGLDRSSLFSGLK